MKFQIITRNALLMTLACSLSMAYAQESYEEDDTQTSREVPSFQKPDTREMSGSELTFQNEFSRFRSGPFFMPPWPGMHFFGYERPRDMFRDFKDNIQSDSDSDTTVCEGQTGDEIDGSIKLTFTCDDGDYTYSCYADNISGAYSVDIPAEVTDKSCLISVETISSNDDESDVEVDGTETTEEVELTEETTVEVDVE